ncbi:MAG: hypothetical protein ACXWO2_09925 [Candidatus Limnocylindrales bacterium]
MILERLRPEPHRGPVIAAGAVPLALAAIVIELRMRQWSLGPKLILVALTAVLILTMGWLAPLESGVPRAYQSVLLVAGLLLLAITLELLAEVLGAHRPPGPGASTWTFATLAAVSAATARRANSGVCTLIAALAGAVALEAFVVWVFHPHGSGTFRAVLVLATLVYIAGAIRLRDRRRSHAVGLVNAAGLTTLLLAVTFVAQSVLAAAFGDLGAVGVLRRQSGAPFGWELYVLAIGFGLVAYASADREPGPAYLGGAVLLSFAVLAGSGSGARDSLVGWPLFLLVIGALGLFIGLRPSRPLPPEPPQPPASSTIPLRAVEDER